MTAISPDLERKLPVTPQDDQVSTLEAARRQARIGSIEVRAGRLAGVGSWELDLATRRLLWSEKACSIHDVPPDRITSLETALGLYAPDATARLQSVIEAAVATGEPWDLELPYTTPTGRALWIRSMGAAEFHASQAVCVLGAFQDVTARHEADERLRLTLSQTLGRMIESESARSASIAGLNHGIRTPMSVIAASAYLMARDTGKAEQQTLLGNIDKALKSMLQLIDEACSGAASRAEEWADAARISSRDSCSPAGASHEGIAPSGAISNQAVPEGIVPLVGSLRLAGTHLLVADDDLSNLEVAERLLGREGARVTCVLDGAQAVQLMREGPRTFDAVLMDLQMPVLDGVSAARLIRGELALKRVPLLALSGETQPSERRRALEAGMDGCISKPFEPDVVVGLLCWHIARARATVSLLVAEAQGQASTVAWPVIEGIDGRDVQRRLQGDRSLFMKLLGSLCREFGDLAVAAPVPSSAGEKAAWAARLHRLGGSAGIISATRVRGAAVAGESAMRDGSGQADLSAPLVAVASAMHQLVSSSAPWLEEFGRQHPGQVSAAARDPLDARDLIEWQVLLRSQNLEAITRFPDVAPGLRRALGEARFKQVEAALERLDFATAVALAGDAQDVGSQPQAEAADPKT